MHNVRTVSWVFFSVSLRTLAHEATSQRAPRNCSEVVKEKAVYLCVATCPALEAHSLPIWAIGEAPWCRSWGRSLPDNSGATGEAGSIPGLGRPLRGGNSNSLQYSCQDNAMDRGAQQATVHGAESDTTEVTERVHTHTHTHTHTCINIYVCVRMYIYMWNFGYGEHTVKISVKSYCWSWGSDILVNDFSAFLGKGRCRNLSSLKFFHIYTF